MKNNELLVYVFFIVIGLFIGTMFHDSIPFIGSNPFSVNKKSEELIRLEESNKKLKIDIKTHNENIIVYRKEMEKTRKESAILSEKLKLSDSLRLVLQKNIDSTMMLINTQDSILVKMYSNKYEEIGDVTDMSLDERIKFFEDRFKWYRPIGQNR